MRGRHCCRLCPRKSRIPVGHCSLPGCGDAFCERHGTWVTDSTVEGGGYWACNRCVRQMQRQQSRAG